MPRARKEPRKISANKRNGMKSGAVTRLRNEWARRRDAKLSKVRAC